MPGTRRPADFQSRNILDLDPEFGGRVNLLIHACRRKKLNLVPFSSRRGPMVQGRMWCQSRTLVEVQSQRKLLEGAGARTLASYLQDQWASTGRWSTDRLPGQSWHQWGEACDFFIEVGGKAVWTDGRFAEVLGKAARDLGLESGALWARGKDPCHVQFRKESTPNLLDGGTPWDEIQDKMGRLYELYLPQYNSDQPVKFRSMISK
jgi:hypothetical protein